MKTIYFAAALFACAFASGEERCFDFENVALGELPQGLFTGGWGARGDGVFIYTTNIRGCESEKSLVLNLMPQTKMGGVGMSLSKGLERGKIVVGFDYCYEQAGNLSFEFRSKEGNWPFFSLGEKLVMRTKKFKPLGTFGEFSPHCWYRVRFEYPLTAQDGDGVTVTVKNLSTGETFGGKNTDWLMKNPANATSLFINYHNSTPSRQVIFIDNLSKSAK